MHTAAPLEIPASSLGQGSASPSSGGVDQSMAHLPIAKTTQFGANVIARAATTLNHPVHVIPFLTPCVSTNHELPRLPINPPTV